MYLSFNHEPENDASYGTPAEFVAAYRRVVELFRAEGVSNVAFVCTLMSSSFEDGGARAAAYYPGDAYVDALGVDAYNWYPGRSGAAWRSFASIVGPARAFARAHGVPLVVPEFGVQEDPGSPGRKAAWIGAAAAAIARWPDVKAVLYFDVDKTYPWQIDSSPLSAAAFASVATWPPLAVLPPFDDVGAAVGLSAPGR
jgi:beta-mannanase